MGLILLLMAFVMVTLARNRGREGPPGAVIAAVARLPAVLVPAPVAVLADSPVRVLTLAQVDMVLRVDRRVYGLRLVALKHWRAWNAG